MANYQSKEISSLEQISLLKITSLLIGLCSLLKHTGSRNIVHLYQMVENPGAYLIFLSTVLQTGTTFVIYFVILMTKRLGYQFFYKQLVYYFFQTLIVVLNLV